MTLQILFKRRESADIKTECSAKTGFFASKISFLAGKISLVASNQTPDASKISLVASNQTPDASKISLAAGSQNYPAPCITHCFITNYRRCAPL
ncbi:MAG: hypothetical protein LBD13_04735 [Spirochaetaceae bacterium]|nr:hypothetical protein [Spirochaetaceae bacterium]